MRMSSPNKKRTRSALVLLSGGLDSATTLYYALAEGYSCEALIFNYSQRHRREVKSAIAVAEAAGCRYRLVRLAMPETGSALLDRSLNVPKDRVDFVSEIPSTYVPARNIVFLSIAAAHAEALGAEAIFIGANAVDYSGYPDCRPEFYKAYQRVLAVGTKAGVEGRRLRVKTPLIHKSKAQIIRLGRRLGVPYELTWSCYAGGRRPCGRCDSCLLRAKGFQQAGVVDPALEG